MRRHPAAGVGTGGMTFPRSIEGRKVMKAVMGWAVGLLVVTLACWLGQAEAGHGGGRGRGGPSHPPKGGARPGTGKIHPAQPKKGHKEQHKPKGGAPKAAEKKRKGLPEAKPDAKKKHA